MDKRTGRLAPQRAQTKEEAGQEMKIDAPRYRVEISLVGVAPTDLEVSRYLAELNAYPLLHDVTLEYSEEKDVEDQIMRQFSIIMRLDPDADMREVDPLIVPRRLGNPMSDEMQIAPPGSRPHAPPASPAGSPSEEGD